MQKRFPSSFEMTPLAQGVVEQQPKKLPPENLAKKARQMEADEAAKRRRLERFGRTHRASEGAGT